MSVTKASLWRRAALTLVVGAAIAIPAGAKASILPGLSVRGGSVYFQDNNMRDLADVAMWGAGIKFDMPWKGFPHVIPGEGWGTAFALDGHYNERTAGIFRAFYAMIDQTYLFERQHGMTPYAGIGFGSVTFGGCFADPASQPTITRFGGGLILGAHFGDHFYWEGRYEWFDSHHTVARMEGFRSYLGYRF